MNECMDVVGWAMVEYIYLCCLEVGAEATATAALRKILGKFGTPKVKPSAPSTTNAAPATAPAVVLEGSERVQLLMGQYKESQGIVVCMYICVCVLWMN